MVISSLVVETRPDATQKVAELLPLTDGVEVHEVVDYKLVVTIEAPTTDDSAQIAEGFQQIDGVTGVNLVYCNFEDDPSLFRGQDAKEAGR